MNSHKTKSYLFNREIENMPISRLGPVTLYTHFVFTQDLTGNDFNLKFAILVNCAKVVILQLGDWKFPFPYINKFVHKENEYIVSHIVVL